MTDAEEFAVLCRKPYNLPLAEYLQLDDWQIVNVWFRPPTAESAKHGYYWPMPTHANSEDMRATRFVYFREGRRNGVPERQIRRGWQRYKMVLLYGIEGPRVGQSGALRSVLAARGESPEAIEAAVAERKREMATARRSMRPEGFG